MYTPYFIVRSQKMYYTIFGLVFPVAAGLYVPLYCITCGLKLYLRQTYLPSLSNFYLVTFITFRINERVVQRVTTNNQSVTQRVTKPISQFSGPKTPVGFQKNIFLIDEY